MHRLYETEDIVVFWDSEKCRHERKCRDGSPRTFDPMRRPWIDLNAAPTAEVWKAVSACPSGALTCVYPHDVKIELDEAAHRSVAYIGSSATDSNDQRTANASETNSPTPTSANRIGECDYDVTPDGWVIYHTEVDSEYGGKGIAKRLIYKIVEAAERAGATVIPTCSYAAKVLGD